MDITAEPSLGDHMATEPTTPEADLACSLVVDACALVERLADVPWPAEDETAEALQVRDALTSVAAGLPPGAVTADVAGALAELEELLVQLERPAAPERLAS